MPRYKLTIAYDGTDFCGWQKQFPHEDSVPQGLVMLDHDGRSAFRESSPPSTTTSTPTPPATESSAAEIAPDRARVELRTVQSVVERAVREVVRQPVMLAGASRTDSGVHAKGQVGAFTCTDPSPKGEPEPSAAGMQEHVEDVSGARDLRGTRGTWGGGWPIARGTDTLRRAINARLPSDVLVTNVEVAPDDFNPITNATSKAYSYHIHTGETRPLWNRRTVLHIWHALDDRAMDDAARLFEGEHDFAGFAAAGHGRTSTVRTVFACRVSRIAQGERAGEIVIDITGNGFLWNMVRIIAGTLVEVGKGKMTRERVIEALTKGDRLLAGPTLPPTGLCLEWIRYADVAAK